MSIPISKMILISLLLSVYLFSQDYEQGQAKADHTQMTSNKFTKIREQMALIPEDIYFKKEAISVIEEMENSTSVQKGLAIETNGFNKVYEAKADTLNKLITPVMKNIDFTKAVSEYKSLPQEQLQNQKYYALHILDTIHSDVFSPTNKVLFPSKKDQHIITLSEALTLKNGNLLFDCDTSSFGYVETLERKFGVKKSPIVLLDCPRHMLIRWKFNDDIYINWETTAGMQPSQD
ncbi:MAG: hypothetical protein NTY22_00975, partial [Proteobacteria bacterium]|nr:hypothetical protein [Pseudomonadota bacterium]